MFRHSPATFPHAIRTGSWLAREALTNAHGSGRYAAASCVIAFALSLAPLAASVARGTHPSHSLRPDLPTPAARPQLPHARTIPYPRLAWPLEISGGQYTPVAWGDIAGWSEGDHLHATQALRRSCGPAD